MEHDTSHGSLLWAQHNILLFFAASGPMSCRAGDAEQGSRAPVGVVFELMLHRKEALRGGGGADRTHELGPGSCFQRRSYQTLMSDACGMWEACSITASENFCYRLGSSCHVDRQGSFLFPPLLSTRNFRQRAEAPLLLQKPRSSQP